MRETSLFLSHPHPAPGYFSSSKAARGEQDRVSRYRALLEGNVESVLAETAKLLKGS